MAESYAGNGIDSDRKDLEVLTKWIKRFSGELDNLSLVVVGEVGSGKTTLVHNLLLKEAPDDPQTTEQVTLQEGSIEDIKVNIHDTPGLGDLGSEEGTTEVEELCQQHTIHAVVVCIALTARRMDHPKVEILEKVYSLKCPTIVALTMADTVSPLEESKDAAQEEVLKKTYFNKQITEWNCSIKGICKKEDNSLNTPVYSPMVVVLPTTGIYSELLPNGHHWLGPLWLAILMTSARRVNYPYERKEEEEEEYGGDELSLQPNDVITDIQWYKDGGWALGTYKGQTGLFHPLLVEQPDPQVLQLKWQQDSEVNRGKPNGCSVIYRRVTYILRDVKENPHDDTCAICRELAHDPVQTMGCCGKTFCEACIQQVRNNSCPHCRTEGLTHHKDPKTKRRIEDLVIFCPNYQHGCDWEGELRNIQEHLDKTCQLQTISCLKNCGGKYKRYLEYLHISHECPLREVTCPFCSLEGESLRELTYKDMKNTHWKECPHWPARCPHLCEDRFLQRGTVQLYLDRHCPKHVISCKYEKFGCRFEAKREEMPKHEQDTQTTHLAMVTEKYEQSSQDIENLKERNLKMQQEIGELKTMVTNLVNTVQVSQENQGEMIGEE